jgi:hypothetical protein
VIFHTLLRGSTLVGEPTAPRPKSDCVGSAGDERGSQFRLVRGARKIPGRVAAWGSLILLPPLLLAQPLAR